MPSEMLAATEDHATLSEAAALESLCWSWTASLGSGSTSIRGVQEMLLVSCWIDAMLVVWEV